MLTSISGNELSRYGIGIQLLVPILVGIPVSINMLVVLGVRGRHSAILTQADEMTVKHDDGVSLSFPL